MESGTIEQTLPGLGAPAVPSPAAIGRAIGLTPNKRLTLVSGRSNPDLAHADRGAPRVRARPA